MVLDRLVIATHNRRKAGEMVEILAARFPGLELRTLADYEGAPEPEETGSTYPENATIKAESGAAFTSAPCLADDAGLEIDALDGAPGLYSKRFGGEALPFPEKMTKILAMLDSIPEAERTARFRCCVALAIPGRPTQTLVSTCEGRIARSMSGAGGFGYDPIFLPDAAPGRTMADLTPSEKHAISHRGKVLSAFGDLWQGLAMAAVLDEA
ncbi:XTP/dITP diphosphatase [soil metagenome]